MTTLIFTHPSYEHHDPGAGHPECPERIRTVWRTLDADPFASLARREAQEASLDQLAAVHQRGYIDEVLRSIPTEGLARLDPDTALSPGSSPAILRAAGAVCDAVDAVVGGEADNAFCAVRPCGHHAEPARAMGFCSFNNIAVGAAHALNAHDINRVAIIDFDVHHGNGTQTTAEADQRMLFASTHQYPFFPGTGAREERGGFNNIVNLPMSAGSGSNEFRAAMTDSILPAVEEFAPQLMLISAGFDAHARDPLAQLELSDEDFAWVTRELIALAGRSCGGRIVSALEGGYDMTGLAESCSAHVRELMNA